MVAAMVLCITGQIIIIPEVRFGGGKHIDQVDPADFQQAFKLNFVTQPIYLWAICLVKLAIGFFLLRVAVVTIYRRIIIGVMTFMTLYTLACFLVCFPMHISSVETLAYTMVKTIVLQCTNLAVQWDPNVKGTCWGPTTLKALSYTNVSLNILTDLLFAIFIPVRITPQPQNHPTRRPSLASPNTS
jgi:hypothetical protein